MKPAPPVTRTVPVIPSPPCRAAAPSGCACYPAITGTFRMLKMLVRQATRSVAEALLAGGAVHRRALVAGAAAGHAGTAARRSALRVRCAPDELMERAVVGTFLGALGQGLRVDRLEPGAAIRIHDGHDDLGTARHVKDDPVELRSARGDLDELSWEYWIHGVSVPA